MAENIYARAKKHKFVVALKKHVESKGYSFDDYLIQRYMRRTDSERDQFNKEEAVISETIAIYFMAQNASERTLQTIMNRVS